MNQSTPAPTISFEDASGKLEDWLIRCADFCDPKFHYEPESYDTCDSEFLEDIASNRGAIEQRIFQSQRDIITADGDVSRVPSCEAYRKADGQKGKPITVTGYSFHEVGATVLLNFTEAIEAARQHGMESPNEIRAFVRSEGPIRHSAIEKLAIQIRRERVLVEGSTITIACGCQESRVTDLDRINALMLDLNEQIHGSGFMFVTVLTGPSDGTEVDRNCGAVHQLGDTRFRLVAGRVEPTEPTINLTAEAINPEEAQGGAGWST